MIAGVLGGLTQLFLPTHLLVIVALGLLVGGRPLALALASLALGLAIGSVTIAFAVREMPAALVLLALAAAAGVLVALALRPPLVPGAFALTAGVAFALNTPPQALTIPMAIAEQAGTALAALVMVGLVALIARLATQPWQQIGVRVVGSWIAASAILALVLRLVR
jgi:urease accessory protein